MNKISVIIPVYNVEPYIRRCLDSVVNQTYTNLEILLINDGSTDNCGFICDEYTAKDSRIKVFHKPNGGLSSALNVGLENFTGDYLGFVDSDDWIERDMFEVLLSAAKLGNVPISVAGYFTDTEAKSVKTENLGRIPEGVVSTENMLVYSLNREYYRAFCGYVWNKLYSADIIRNSNIRFDERIGFAMDALFFTSLVTHTKCTGVYIDKPLYHYIIRDSSISNNNPLRNRKYTFPVYQTIIDMLDGAGYQNVSIWPKKLYCFMAGYYAEIAIEFGNGEILAELQKEIKLYLKEYIDISKQYPDRVEWITKLLAATHVV